MASVMSMKRQLSTKDMEIFNSEFNKRKKSAGLAFAFWFLLPLSIHRFYLGQWMAGLIFMAGNTFLGAYLLILLLGGNTSTTGGPEALILLAMIGILVWELTDIFRIGRLTDLSNHRIEQEILWDLRDLVDEDQ